MSSPKWLLPLATTQVKKTLQALRILRALQVRRVLLSNFFLQKFLIFCICKWKGRCYKTIVFYCFFTPCLWSNHTRDGTSNILEQRDIGNCGMTTLLRILCIQPIYFTGNFACVGIYFFASPMLLKITTLTLFRSLIVVVSPI